MPKRNYATEEEESVSNESSKRARTEDSDEEEPSQAQTRRKRESRKKNKGKGKAHDSEEEDEYDEGGAVETQGDQEVDDEEYERKYGAGIRAHLESKRLIQGVRLLNSLVCNTLNEF